MGENVFCDNQRKVFMPHPLCPSELHRAPMIIAWSLASSPTPCLLNLWAAKDFALPQTQLHGLHEGLCLSNPTLEGLPPNHDRLV
jgi:hypothetical protein